MLARSSYDQADVDACRANVDAVLAAADAPLLLNNMVIVLDAWFAHRQRSLEGKDGNPINEVRLIAAALIAGGGAFATEKSIKYQPEASVLGLAEGDRIEIDHDGFARLAAAYLAEIEQRFVSA